MVGCLNLVLFLVDYVLFLCLMLLWCIVVSIFVVCLLFMIEMWELGYVYRKCGL